MSTNWSDKDLTRLYEAEQASLFSPDPSMKCGTVIYNWRINDPEWEELVGTGWNDMPVGCRSDAEVWNNRPLKYDRVVHGEVNAVLDAGLDASGATAYCWPPGVGPACSRCAAVMIQAGIATVFYVDRGASAERWQDSVRLGNDMFAEAGVRLVGVPLDVYTTFHAGPSSNEG